MNFSKKNILVLTDGSQGMISQVEGLAKQFSNNFQSIETKLIFPWSKLQPNLLPIFKWIFLNNLKIIKSPDIIISCGRKSVYLSLYLKRKYNKSISIHIQNPKTNFNKFRYIIAPEHDGINGVNVFKSIGALHKFNDKKFLEVEDNDFNISKYNLFSIIIGGKNKHYDFSIKQARKLIVIIKEIKRTNPKYNFLILSSRRTSSEIKELIEFELGKLTFIWKENEKNPYVYALKYSKFFIVTSDSTSMISECAFTGKPIFIFHLPFKRKSMRILNFHNQFNKLNITKKLDKKCNLTNWNYNFLNESERIAGILKERIIKENR